MAQSSPNHALRLLPKRHRDSDGKPSKAQTAAILKRHHLRCLARTSVHTYTTVSCPEEGHPNFHRRHSVSSDGQSHANMYGAHDGHTTDDPCPLANEVG